MLLRGRRMLVLSPFPDWPLYGGPVVRIHHLVRHLCRHNRVWWVTRGPLRGPPPEGLAGHVAGSPQRWLSLFDPLLLARLTHLVRSERLQVVLASSLIAGLHGACLQALTGGCLILDEHNAEFELRPWVAPVEGWLCRRAEEVWCVSDRDGQALIRRYGPLRVRQVPNGVDLARMAGPRGSPAELRRRLGLPGGPLALFLGVMTYAPNREAVDLLLREVAPRLPEVGFVLAGLGSEAWGKAAPNVHAVGFVDDVVDVLRACDVVVVPLRSGSGTRLKVLEALAAGRPVVSTPKGVEGLHREALGPGLQVEDDWSRFAEAVRRALASPSGIPPGLALYDWERLLEVAL
ncbi:MAG: glycosyltransferase family 4 protein [Candidatus Eremiobacterota bacterium]